MFKKTIGVFFLLAGATQPAFAAQDSLGKALEEGSAKLTLRYRVEAVDQDGLGKDALASTLRTRATFKTGSWNGLSLLLEADNVAHIGADKFNTTRNGQTNYPVVADPTGSEINQAYFEYKANKSAFKLGKQRILIDDQRMVGGVGWRQNEQTYTGFRYVQDFESGLQTDYSYVSRVHRIFGPENGTPTDNFDGDIHLFNVDYKSADLGRFQFFAHSMDFDKAVANSNRTLGVRYRYQFKTEGATWPLELYYASQDDTGDNPVSYSADLTRLEFGYKKDALGLKVGFESLSGDDTAGKTFRTPLATLHKFQGWADKFLSTPAGGVQDTYVSFSYGAFKLIVHDFEAESGSGDYGSEIDASWSHKFNDNVSLLVKYADYNADDHATDSQKIWLMLTVST